MSTRIKLLRELNEGEKLAPQQQVIYDELKSIGIGKEVEREDLIKKLEDGGNMKTRQPVSRIVAYYTGPMKKDGLIEVLKPAPAPKAEKKDKPAKENSPASAPEKPAKTA